MKTKRFIFTALAIAMFITACSNPFLHEDEDDGGGSGGGGGVSIPSRPSGVTASAGSSSSITIRWSSVSGATSYNVYRSSSANGTYSLIGNTRSATYTDTGLSADTTYYYKVAAQNSKGTSSQSSYASGTTSSGSGGGTTPNTPTGLSVTGRTASSISLSWSSVSGATAYYVYRSSSADGTYSQVGNPTSTSYTNTGLTQDTTYYYRVAAYNSAGTSSRSSSVSGTTLSSGGGVTTPNTPTGLSVTGRTTSSITLSWNSVSGATAYYVYRSSSATGTYTSIVTSMTTSYTNTGLTQDTTYYYKVAAHNSAGTSSQSSYVSGTTLFDGGGGTAPIAPAWIDVTNRTTSSISLSWGAVSGATGYYVYRSSSADGNYAQIANRTTTSYTDTGLTQDTTYYYKAAAYNSYGTSPQTPYRQETTLSSGGTAPSTPTGLITTGATVNSISLSWNSVSGATYYFVYRSLSANGSYSHLGDMTETKYTDTSLALDTTYYYKVAAYNNTGTSPQSSYIYAVTLSSVANSITISGTPRIGQTHTAASTGTGWTSDSYIWAYTEDDAEEPTQIPNAFSSTFTIPQGYAGRYIIAFRAHPSGNWDASTTRIYSSNFIGPVQQ